MIDLNINDYKVSVYTDIAEWTEEMYDTSEYVLMPSDECMGFADIEDKEIYIYVPTNYDKLDLVLTVAHEVGHIVDISVLYSIYKVEGKEEAKAVFFEDFYRDVEEVVDEIILALEVNAFKHR